MRCVTGAVFITENEQEDCVRGPGPSVRVGHVVRDVRRAAAVRQAGGLRFPRVRRAQAGRPVRRRLGQRRVVRGLRPAPAASQAARVGRDRRGTGTRRHRVRAAGRHPRGLAPRGRGHRQEIFARRRRRLVCVT